MPDVTINYIAVIAAALSSMILGFVWYGPLFGKQWMMLVGMTKEHMEVAKKKGMGQSYGLAMLGAVVTACVMAHFVDFIGVSTVQGGMQVGFWAWLGFVSTTSLSKYIWTAKPKPWTLYVLENGYDLANLMIQGAIVAVWL